MKMAGIGYAKDPMSRTGLAQSTNVIKGPGAPQLSQPAPTQAGMVAPPQAAPATPEGIQQAAQQAPQQPPAPAKPFQPGQPSYGGPGAIHAPGEGPISGQAPAQPLPIVPSPSYPQPTQSTQRGSLPAAPLGNLHGYERYASLQKLAGMTPQQLADMINGLD